MSFLSYLFWPNPGNASYGDPKVLLVLGACVALLIGSLALRLWRKSTKNPVARKLSRSWASSAFWFGVIGLVLAVARVEDIQFVSMRFLWVLWGGALLLVVLFHIRQFRSRHYAILPRAAARDLRDKYLP